MSNSSGNESSGNEEVTTATEQENNAIERKDIDATEHRDRPQKRPLDGSHEEEGSFKRQRFEALADDEQNEWQLPEEMVKYLNRYSDKFIQEKSLKDSVLLVNPVPTNVPKPKRLDCFFF